MFLFNPMKKTPNYKYRMQIFKSHVVCSLRKKNGFGSKPYLLLTVSSISQIQKVLKLKSVAYYTLLHYCNKHFVNFFVYEYLLSERKLWGISQQELEEGI